jgi:multidrug efflux pump subunit AcrA (membrane-fusion protein)
MKTEIDLSNPGHRILPGMFGTVTLEFARDPNSLFLPDLAVRQGSDGKKFVYAVENGRLRKMEVMTGEDDGKMIRVFGLQGQEAIVLSGGENLQGGIPVKAVKSTQQMDSRGGH